MRFGLVLVALKAPREAYNLNLQGALKYAWHVRSHFSFGLPLRIDSFRFSDETDFEYEMFSILSSARA